MKKISLMVAICVICFSNNNIRADEMGKIKPIVKSAELLGQTLYGTSKDKLLSEQSVDWQDHFIKNSGSVAGNLVIDTVLNKIITTESLQKAGIEISKVSLNDMFHKRVEQAFKEAVDRQFGNLKSFSTDMVKGFMLEIAIDASAELTRELFGGEGKSISGELAYLAIKELEVANAYKSGGIVGGLIAQSKLSGELVWRDVKVVKGIYDVKQDIKRMEAEQTAIKGTARYVRAYHTTEDPVEKAKIKEEMQIYMRYFLMTENFWGKRTPIEGAEELISSYVYGRLDTHDKRKHEIANNIIKLINQNGWGNGQTDYWRFVKFLENNFPYSQVVEYEGKAHMANKYYTQREMYRIEKIKEKNKSLKETEEKLKTVTESNVYNPEILLNNQLNQLAAHTQGLTSHFGAADYFMSGTSQTDNTQYENHEYRPMETAQENPYLESGSVIIEAPADIVLAWGSTPADLDSHLTGPMNSTGSERFHTSFRDKGSLDNQPNVMLYTDNTRHSVGGENSPEQTRINVTQPGKYNFYVHDFSNRTETNSTAMSNSGAVVSVHTAGSSNLPEGNNLGEKVAEYNVPTNQVGTAWHTFELDTVRNTIKPVNEFQNVENPDNVPFND